MTAEGLMLVVRDAGSSRHSRWKFAALSALVFGIVTCPVTLLALAFWAADGPWEFTGGGFRDLVFTKGSTIDRLGFETATGGPPR